MPWTFRVVDDPTPNAFALPGGYIFFTRGMMNLMTSEAQLAAVLGPRDRPHHGAASNG